MIRDIFSNSFETESRHNNKNLLTHFYQNSYEDTKEKLFEVLKQFNYVVKDDNADYKEVLAEGRHGDLIITFNSVSYYLTGVDFKINGNYIFPLNRPIKMIKELYNCLDKKLILKNIGDNNA